MDKTTVQRRYFLYYWGLCLLFLIYSTNVLAETGPIKISDERAITGLVIKVETFNKEKLLQVRRTS